MSLRLSLLPLTFVSACFWTACAPHNGADAKAPTVAQLRKSAERDQKQTSAWFLAELLSPDGSPAKAQKARQALDRLLDQ